jgi:thiosulfate dehydrogenase
MISPHVFMGVVRVRGFVIGFLACVVLLGGLAWLAAVAGLVPANADAKPSALERWYARAALNAAVKRGAPKSDNPVPATPQNLLAGMHLYNQNCAVCHGRSDGAPSSVAQGLYQRPPQFGKHGVEDDPAGETYWKVDHGIRLTGMPNFEKTLTEKQKWQVTLFLQKMNQLPPAVRAAWEAQTASLF